MLDFRWYRGANLAPRYLATGRSAGSLYPLLSYLSGVRDVLERQVLRLPPLVLTSSRSLPEQVEELLLEAVEERRAPYAALLLYTGDYKETFFVGPVALADDGGVVFWKAFPSLAAREAELRRITWLGEVMPSNGRLAKAKPLGNRLVEYEPIVRVRQSASMSELVRFAIRLGEHSVRHGASEAPVRKLLSDLPVVREFVRLEGKRLMLEISEISEHLERAVRSGLYLSHGDLTPWNAFPTTESAVGLIDYDAVGFRPAMYDVVHLMSQVAVERGAAPPVAEIRSRLQSKDLSGSLGPCLLWDACETMTQYVQNPANRRRTGRAAQLKLEAWRNVAGDDRQ